jgi:UDP-N-acetylglucosamine 1-carboxyvinyltransferase
VALADLLNLMGARIQGAGTGTITIEGVDALSPVETEVIPDRIEAGTLAIAAAMTGGDVRITRCVPGHLGALIAKLEEAGARVEVSPGTLRVSAPGGLVGIDITTLPYPGFPTDLQAQMMSLAARAEGVSRLTETIFPERFNHVPELRRMGVAAAFMVGQRDLEAIMAP